MKNNIHCTFYRPEKTNISEYENIIGKLELDLNTICSETVRKTSLYCYAANLLSLAEPLEPNPEMSFLGLDQPKAMPSDARVMYFYRPTYLAAAFVMKSILLCPDLMDDATEAESDCEARCRKLVHDVLPGVLYGCTGRAFKGHGYDALEGLLDTMRIFAKAGAGTFVQKYPMLCEKFTRQYNDAIDFIDRSIKEGKLCNDWGDDYTDAAREVLIFHSAEGDY